MRSWMSLRGLWIAGSGVAFVALLPHCSSTEDVGTGQVRSGESAHVEALPQALVTALDVAAVSPQLEQLLTMRAVGGVMLQDGKLTAAQPVLSQWDFGADFGLTSDESIVVRAGHDGVRSGLKLSPQGAASVPVLLAEGRAIYANAYPSTDAIWMSTSRKLHQVLVLRDAGAPKSFSFRLELGDDLTVPSDDGDGTLVVHEAQGDERYRIVAPRIVDARAQRAGKLSYRDGYLFIEVDAETVQYPIVIEWGVEAPPLQTKALPAQVPARVMVLVDTSGSMGLPFAEPPSACNSFLASIPGGDGSTSYTDKNVTNANLFPGQLKNGVYQGINSRMYAAKAAIGNAVNAYSSQIDFGLMAFDFTLCGFNSPKCMTCDWLVSPSEGHPLCQVQGYYCLYRSNDNASWERINWESPLCTTGAGGKIIVQPGSSSGGKVLPWIDGIEDHRTSGDGNNNYGTGSTPLNPEIRAQGSTPLAQSIDRARTDWFTAAKAADPQAACRSYALIAVSDGAQQGTISCTKPNECPSNKCENGQCTCSSAAQCGAYSCIDGYCASSVCYQNPAGAAKDLYDANPSNPVKTYVIGMAIGKLFEPQLNAIAASGGTGDARFANSQGEIEAAFADISASSVKYELCNGIDDTCNTAVDEGLGVYRECDINTTCGSGACTDGRCRCSTDAHCGAGYSCSGGFCAPSCSVGVGACYRSGVRKCSGTGTACCVNDGLSACTGLVAGATATEICNGTDDDCDGLIDEDNVCQSGCQPSLEVCNGLDDDCDGVADDTPIDVGQPCGFSIGICSPGITACQAGKLVCTGGVQPGIEVCNGLDDDCDGVTDGMTGTCYTGPVGTQNLGVCQSGQRNCTAVPGSGVESWSACVGEIKPSAELCNGLDDDCNMQVDDITGLNDACCPFTDSQGQPVCGTGICASGTLKCVTGVNQPQCTGAVGPSPELCDGLDNDCNGSVDDLPSGNIGQACCPSGKCGTGECKAGVTKCTGNGIICDGAVSPTPELCDGKDNDCNGAIDDIPGVGKPCPGACQAGVLKCTITGLVCEGAIDAQPEVCDGVDNNCNGIIDDVPGVGQSCCPPGSPDGPAPGACSKGICKPGVTLCEGNEIVCKGGIAPKPELCDGIDNDCDGEIDDLADVEASDPAIGLACEEPTAPNDQAPCQAGLTACVAAKAVCKGAVAPGVEVCDGQDNDCDGVPDNDAECAGDAICLNGMCVKPCEGGEFPCAGGFTCEDGYCIPTAETDAGTGGSGGSGGSAGSGGGGGSTVDGGSAGAGGSAGSGTGGGSTGGSAGSSNVDAGAEPAPAATPADEGGCGCTTAGSSGRSAAGLASLLMMGMLMMRGRRSKGGAK